MAKKMLPKKVYIRWNTEGDEDWLECSEDPALLGEFQKGQIAAEYKQVRKVRIIHKTETKTIK